MTEQKSDAKKPPGSGAGDAAHSTRIPSLERSESGAQNGAESSVVSTDRPTTKPNGTKTETRATQTDKGRTRPTSGPKPLSAGDYARTTSSSPDTTSVIPSVKEDEPVEKTEPAPVAEKKPAFARPEPAESTSARWTEEPVTSEKVTPAPAAAGLSGGRSAVLRLSYVEPWSVTRMAFAVSVALMIVAVVATAIFWTVLEVTGIWDQVNGSVTTVLSDDAAGFDITDYLGFGRLVGLALVLSALNVVIMTVLATIAAHLYNLAAQLLGGFQVKFVSKQ